MQKATLITLTLVATVTAVANDSVAVITMRAVGDPQINVFMVDSGCELTKAPVTVKLSRGMHTNEQLKALTPAGIRLCNSLQRVNGFISVRWPTKEMFHVRIGKAFDWDEIRPLVVAVIKQSCTEAAVEMFPEAKEEVLILVEGEIGSRKRTYHISDRISTSHDKKLLQTDPNRRFDTLMSEEKELIKALLMIEGVTSLILNPCSFTLGLAQEANAVGVHKNVKDILWERYDLITIRHLE